MAGSNRNLCDHRPVNTLYTNLQGTPGLRKGTYGNGSGFLTTKMDTVVLYPGSRSFQHRFPSLELISRIKKRNRRAFVTYTAIAVNLYLYIGVCASHSS